MAYEDTNRITSAAGSVMPTGNEEPGAQQHTEQHPRCRTCDHYEPDEQQQGTGRCMLLSFVDVEDEPDRAGSEMAFYCKDDWYCRSHSDNDADEEGPAQPAPQPEREQPLSQEESGGQRTGSPMDYLR